MNIKKDFGEQVDQFTSVYRKDFPKKTCEIPKPKIIEPEYPDIIAEAFKDYLLPDSVLANLKEPHEFEQGGKFYQRLVKEIPSITRHVDKDVDQEFLNTFYQNNLRTVYQNDFCRIEDGFVSKRTLAGKRIELPDDWGEPPLTIQRKSYRDPKKILREGESLASKMFKPPITSFELNPKIKEILQIRTGDTEYQSVVGHLGEQICKDKYYGEIELLPNELVPGQIIDK